MRPIDQSEVRNPPAQEIPLPGPSHRQDCQAHDSQIQTLSTSGESYACFSPTNAPVIVPDSFSQTQNSAFHNQILTEAGFQKWKTKNEKVLFEIQPREAIRQNPREKLLL